MIREVEVNLLHECGHQCGDCSGSGEGQHDGSTCHWCKGRGFIGRGEVEEKYTVEIEDEEHNSVIGPVRCATCDMDLTEQAQEEVNAGRYSE